MPKRSDPRQQEKQAVQRLYPPPTQIHVSKQKRAARPAKRRGGG